ncbi:MAG: hypothetical protein C4521_01850 [Actinobacteria bacterium]|nr:MAG: hypothetical protein C4521_01850 [Actinomycetota bacterium]
MTMLDVDPMMAGGEMPKRTKRQNLKTPGSSEADLDRIRKMADEDWARFQELRSRWEEDQRLYELREPTKKIPEGEEKPVVLNDPQVYIKKISGKIARYDHGVEHAPRKPDGKETAQLFENAAKRARRQWDFRYSEGVKNRLNFDEAQMLLLRGFIAGRILLRTEPPDDDPFEYCPWDYRPFDASNLAWFNAGGRLVRVTHRYTATIGELLDDENFPEAQNIEDYNAEDADLTETVEVTCVYMYGAGYDFYAAYTDKGFVANPVALGYMPWIIMAATGAFYEQTPWDKTEYVRYQGTGFLEAFKGNLSLLERYLTMFATQLAGNSNPATALFTNDEGKAEQIDIRPGAKMVFAQNDKFTPVQIGASPQQYQAFIQWLQDRVNKATVPAAWFGEGQGLNTAMETSLLLGAAADTLWPYIDTLTLFYAMVYRKAFALFGATENSEVGADLDQPYMVLQPRNEQTDYLTWTEMTPLQVRMQGTHFECYYRDMTPQDMVAMGQLAVMAVREQIMSRDTARGKGWFNLQDPSLENMKIVGESLYTDPNIIRLLAPYYAQKTGDKTIAQVAQQIYFGQLAGMFGGQAAGKSTPRAGMLGGEAMPPGMAGQANTPLNIAELLLAAQGGGGGLGGAGEGGVPPGSPMTEEEEYYW